MPKMLASFFTLAVEGSGAVRESGGWFLENVWLVPLIPAISFMMILFFGKRMPRGGSEVGIAAVVVAFVLSLLTAGQWIGQVNAADNYTGAESALVASPGEVAATELAVEAGAGSGPGCFADDKHGDDDHDHDDHSDDEHATGSLGNLTPGSESASAPIELAVEEGGGGGAAPCPVISTTTWWSNGGIDFTVGTFVDGLTVTLLIVVTLVSMLVHVYSTDYVAGDRRYTHFFAFLSLFTSAMLFFVVSENVLQMIVGWELVGVCSFALIGHWWEEKPNSDAALKAFLTNRVGDMGLLIGMIILFFAAGETWSVFEINQLANQGGISRTALTVAAICLLAAVMSKSGQFILHTWLPDAMAGPAPVSALIHAATMVVAGIYMIARLYGVFFNGLTIAGSSINLLALIGGLTTLVGASLAFVQNDIKKVLAYSTISQLGYMAMALGVGAWTAAVFHLMTHAFFKACLFLGAGSVSHSSHSFDMKEAYGGMRKFMPHTYRTFLIGSLALAGLPPLAGFWSKDEILAGTGAWPQTGGNGTYTIMLVMGIMTAVMTAAYMTRVIYLTFFGEFRGAHLLHHDDGHGDGHDDHGHDDHGHGDHHDLVPHESGPRIVIPLYILAFLAVFSGFLNFPLGFQLVPEGWQARFEHFVEPRPDAGYFPAISHAVPSWSLAIVSTILVLCGVAFAYNYYFRRVNAQNPAGTELVGGLTSRNRLAKAGHTLLVNKYYLDHLYTGVIAAFTKGPLAKAAYWFNQNVLDRTVDNTGRTAVRAADVVYNRIDQPLVDGAVNLSGRASQGAGGELRRLQTGKVQQYAGLMFAATAVLAGLIIVFA